MLMNITDITLPMMTQIPTCNVTGCRGQIAEYFSLEWAFYTEDFEICDQCPQMSLQGGYINYSPDWFPMWSVEDFFIENSNGQDCENNPIKGDMLDCMVRCFSNTTCVAFSRKKTIDDDDRTGECWLKTNITVNQIPDDPEWHTVVFNPPS
jgi:hypothetical protein